MFMVFAKSKRNEGRGRNECYVERRRWVYVSVIGKEDKLGLLLCIRIEENRKRQRKMRACVLILICN